jgi:predicted  nucleic acid-binding Zn-ribbon protein
MLQIGERLARTSSKETSTKGTGVDMSNAIKEVISLMIDRKVPELVQQEVSKQIQPLRDEISGLKDEISNLKRELADLKNKEKNPEDHLTAEVSKLSL